MPIVGTHDVLLITLDTLRYDVAQARFNAGRLPILAEHLPASGWEERHAPGNFTFASHQAMFAGFLPTPLSPGPHPRRFALRFSGSTTIDQRTEVFDAPTIVQGFADAGYKTICIGGVGFFNQLNPLGSVLPDLFQEQHWSPALGVTDPNSTENQVALARERIVATAPDERIFLFINVSALHQPNHFYGRKPEGTDTLQTHGDALEYVDGALAPLWQTCAARRPTFCIVCSDHGTAYGEDGYFGHRISHPTVWNVPYAEFFLGDEVSE